VLDGEENWKRSGAREVGFAIWEAAEEGIERKAFVLPVVNKKDGISESGSGAVPGRHDIGGTPCGLFGGAARTPKVSVRLFIKNVIYRNKKNSYSKGRQRKKLFSMFPDIHLKRNLL
jgi:hypothetical protein